MAHTHRRTRPGPLPVAAVVIATVALVAGSLASAGPLAKVGTARSGAQAEAGTGARPDAPVTDEVRAQLAASVDVDVDIDGSGHRAFNADATVSDGETTTLDVPLTPIPRHRVAGTVRDDTGEPVVGAVVTIVGTPLPSATTGADGAYGFPEVIEGEYDIGVVASCRMPQTRTVAVTGDVTVDFTLDRRDAAGYTCDEVPADYVEADTPYWPGDSPPVRIPFPFRFYNQTYTRVFVGLLGYLNFLGEAGNFTPGPIPTAALPNGSVYPFWDLIFVDDAESVHTGVVGEAPNRALVIEWRDVTFYDDQSRRVSFEVKLHEGGDIEFQYRGIDPDPTGRELGGFATVGIENSAGDDALVYSYREPRLRSDLGVRFRMPTGGFVQGRVTDANDGTPLGGAAVRALEDGTEMVTTTTAEDGSYRLRVYTGTYTVEAAYLDQGTTTTTVVIDEGEETVIADFDLALARLRVAADPIELVLPPDRTASRNILVENAGVGALEFEVTERPGGTGDEVRPAEPADPAGPSLAGDPVLLVRDALPYYGDAMGDVLVDEQVRFEVIGSAQLTTADLDGYRAVILSNNQPLSFYDNYRVALPRLTAYVEQGGLLWFGAGSYLGGDGPPGEVLPGGATVETSFQSEHDVVDPDHPIMQGVPDRFSSWLNYTIFDHVPEGADVITRGVLDPRPSIVEYQLGAGRVLGTIQSFEIDFEQGSPGATILRNAVRYAGAFEPSADIPWLSVTPAGGTVAPGASRRVRVTVDTAGLAPGVHRAQVVVRGNDPFNRTERIPVQVLVPLYQVAVDAGSGRSFTDAAGDTWAADRRFTAGGWGYTNGRSSALTTGRAIAGTADDPLFRTVRSNPLEYRFDDVPNGIYQVDYRFAENNGRRPGRRVFRLILEQTLVDADHDISADAGTYAADAHTVFIEVTDGRLNVRFAETTGFGVPIVSGLRVTHRADR